MNYVACGLLGDDRLCSEGDAGFSPFSHWEKVRMRVFWWRPHPDPLPEGEGDDEDVSYDSLTDYAK